MDRKTSAGRSTAKSKTVQLGEGKRVTVPELGKARKKRANSIPKEHLARPRLPAGKFVPVRDRVIPTVVEEPKK